MYCRTCYKDKPTTDFYPSVLKAQTKKECKTCRKNKTNSWRSANIDTTRLYGRKYYRNKVLNKGSTNAKKHTGVHTP